MAKDNGDALRELRDQAVARQASRSRIPRFTPWTTDDTVGTVALIIMLVTLFGLAAGWFE
jgi:hypothetical protein